ncbi:MAG: rod shape-determining protein RodA [Atopobiaceae bacterium]|nr:rod shape-determining protein RodA [Atopobiaceae bacterium]
MGSSKIQRKGFWSQVYLMELIPNVLLVIFGAVVIWSASLTMPDASFPRHMVGILLGFILAVVVWQYDYSVFADKSTFLLILDVVLMLMPSIPGLGYNAMGMTGWVQIPLTGFRFQPSELAKPVTILLMASLVASYNGKIETLKDYLKLCGILCIPFLLILTQPDLGTGLIVLVLGAAIIICGGARGSWVLVTVGIIVVGAFAVVASSLTEGMPHILKQYQLNRLIVFVDPSVDPSGNGYNLQQAKIAVGSGGILGKGIGNATQSGGGFLPEAHTDFVFALLAEEFGFIGSSALLLLFGWMILATVGLALRVESPFAKLVCVGVAAMWAFQLMQNVGMCIGIMPITGIPLPFVSFGSSSMLAQLMSAGLVQSVWRHRSKPA